ncbi:myosin-13-like [Bactrocera dorsalis]|uniref:Myosin-13-like n=1 Tax=Bactrocera dorsalis TaxID=27457 RepID=A0ABM3K4L3_BACDO|nr:myosin-13-like [Bactrocera dorsalis]XP_049316418.1 myosin-13-like [Bactrocera dorsalis]
MVKFGELRIQALKKELEERNLPISGQKADLQARLREAMEADGINVDEFEFVGPETSTKVEEKVEEQRTSSSVDMNMLLVAIQKIAENTENAVQTGNRLAQQIAENAEKAVQTENRLAQQIAENTSQIADNAVQTENRLAQQIAENTSQLESRLTQQHRLVQQITENTTQLQKQVQEKFSKFEDELSTLKNDEENLKAEVLQLSNRVRELEVHGPAPSTNNQRLKAPTFDGSIPFQIFKLQFEKTAMANNWNAADKVASLFLSLKGPAAEILQTIPDCERDNYEALMSAIERRYGSEHRKQIYQIELQIRGQKINESLQEFATEIERLAHLANADAPVDYIERVKIQCFINGIRDVDTKRATYALPKGTFAETVSHALTQETASLLSKPAHKVQRVEMEQPALMEEILKTLKTIAAQRVNTTGRCFNCRKAGHFARNCKIKVNPSKWKQPTEHRKRIHHKNADALSHRPCPLEFKHCSKSEGKEGIIDVRLLNIEPEDDWTPHRIRINQLEDPDLAKLIIAKENGVRPPKEQISSESPTAKAYWAQWNSINLVNGYLHRTWESEDGKQSRLLIIVPKSMIPKVLKEYHNGPSGGHLGITKTIEKIKQRFYWIGCRDSIAEWISNCVECMAA